MSLDPRGHRVVVGVDTHEHVHVAVVLDDIEGRLADRPFPAHRGGYEQLFDWATDAFGAEKMILATEGAGGLMAPA